jgi:lysophospholipase L1-like esterase
MRVLLLGDSHTFGTYGSALEGLFRNAGWDVTRVGWVGAAASHYLKGTQEKIGLGGTGDFAAARGRRYDVAVISLGTNDAAALRPGQPADAAAADIRRLADQLNAGSIVYVGPPAFSDNAARTYNAAFAQESLDRKTDRMWQAAAPLFERAIDPREATRPFVQKTDIHFGPKGGKAWAQSVFSAVSGGPALAPVSGGGASKAPAIVAALVVFAGIGFWLWKRRK